MKATLEPLSDEHIMGTCIVGLHHQCQYSHGNSSKHMHYVMTIQNDVCHGGLHCSSHGTTSCSAVPPSVLAVAVGSGSMHCPYVRIRHVVKYVDMMRPLADYDSIQQIVFGGQQPAYYYN